MIFNPVKSGSSWDEVSADELSEILNKSLDQDNKNTYLIKSQVIVKYPDDYGLTGPFEIILPVIGNLQYSYNVYSIDPMASINCTFLHSYELYMYSTMAGDFFTISPNKTTDINYDLVQSVKFYVMYI